MHEALLKMLAEDHRGFEQSLDTMLDTSTDDAKARQGLVYQLQSEFLVHTYGEERGLYQILKEHDETRSIALRGCEEHHVARMLLDELAGLPLNNESWQAKAAVIAFVLRSHIESEERLVFVYVRQLFTAEQAEQALQILEDEKRTEMALR